MQIGTRVRLASGGPVMLVVEFHPKIMTVLCAWDDQEDWFHIVTLDVVRNYHAEYFEPWEG
jgi:uncharacterized protein YodC (DUF2158 family)